MDENGEPNACNDNERSVTKMKAMVTTMTDKKVKEMIAMVQEFGGAMTNDQLQAMIAGIQEEDGDGGARCTRKRERGWAGR